MPARTKPVARRVLRPPRRHPLRRLLRVVLWLCALLLTPVLIWFVANRFDEAPSAAAERLAQPLVTTSKDADNAWLYLLGIGAAADADPIELGRRRVDAYQARIRQHPTPAASAEETALFTDAVAAVKPDARVDHAAELCRPRIVDCIAWAQAMAPMLQRLRAANALRLQRYEHLLQLPQWEVLFSETLEVPTPNYPLGWLRHSLLAYDAALALDAADTASIAAITHTLATEVQFWRRVLASPQDLLTTLVAATNIERCQLLLNNLLDRLDTAQHTALAEDIALILQAPAAPVDWSVVTRRQHQMFDHTMRGSVADWWGSARHCVTWAQKGCSELVMASGYAHQATLNRYAALGEAMQAWLDSSPRAAADAKASYAEVFERHMPAFGDLKGIWQLYRYNPVGKILAPITVPKSDWAQRLHDLEAQRRMLVLKTQALQRGVSNRAMPAFLDEQNVALRNPYSGEAFRWDAHHQEIGYPPAAQYWQRPMLTIGYRAAAPVVVDPCSRPVALLLVADGTTSAVRVVSCANGNLANSDPADAGGTWPAFQVRALRVDGATDVQVLHDRDGTLYAYELPALAEGGDAIPLQPRGHDGSHALHVSVNAVADRDHISVQAQALAAQAVLRDIARAKQLRIDGIERLANRRISLRGDMPWHRAVERIAAAAALRVRDRGPRHVALEP